MAYDPMAVLLLVSLYTMFHPLGLVVPDTMTCKAMTIGGSRESSKPTEL